MTKKRFKIWLAAVASIFGLAAFTTWGFDPANWDALDRFWFGVTLIFLPLWAAAFPLLDD